MNPNIPISSTDILYFFLAILVIGLVISSILLVYVIWRFRHLRLPEGAGFMDTLRATPLSVVLLLDFLDFALDIFSAPITWIILSYLGLKQLRTVAVVKDVIPISQFIPAMTLAWIFARVIT